MRWKLTERAGPKVRRRTFGEAAAALDALEARAGELARTAPGEVVDVKIRRFEPAEQVVARLELAGPERLVPSVRVGLDVHGDGSVTAYRGRVRREIIGGGPDGETPYAALRRLIAQRS